MRIAHRSIPLSLPLAALAVAACDAPQSPPKPSSPQPAFVQQGDIRRLNIISAKMEQSIRFKDPIQGTRNAKGECVFGVIPNPRVGYRFLVGEWNVKTCAGVVYYFDRVPENPSRRYEWRVDTITFNPPARAGDDLTLASNDPWAPCSWVTPPFGTPDTLRLQQAWWAWDDYSNSYNEKAAYVDVTLVGRHIAPTQYNGGCVRLQSGVIARVVDIEYAWRVGSSTENNQSYDPQMTITPAEYAKLHTWSLFRDICNDSHSVGRFILDGGGYGEESFDLGMDMYGNNYYDWGWPGPGTGEAEGCGIFQASPRLLMGEIIKW